MAETDFARDILNRDAPRLRACQDRFSSIAAHAVESVAPPRPSTAPVARQTARETPTTATLRRSLSVAAGRRHAWQHVDPRDASKRAFETFADNVLARSFTAQRENRARAFCQRGSSRSMTRGPSTRSVIPRCYVARSVARLPDRRAAAPDCARGARQNWPPPHTARVSDAVFNLWVIEFCC